VKELAKAGKVLLYSVLDRFGRDLRRLQILF